MNSSTLAQLQTRLHHVERQNRILLALLCALIGLALLGASKGGGNVITADEVRTHRLSLINDKDNVVHEWVVHGGMGNGVAARGREEGASTLSLRTRGREDHFAALIAPADKLRLARRGQSDLPHYAP